jgi:hypothetical protein
MIWRIEINIDFEVIQRTIIKTNSWIIQNLNWMNFLKKSSFSFDLG